MDCVNHAGSAATAYCQNCGRGLCANCTRRTATGQILCEVCQAACQSAPPFPLPHSSHANPTVAALLGVIPGVGAMYNGQFFKALVHVVVFVLIVNITSEHAPYVGLFIPAWILYQVFEAYQTARARRDGLPIPDPFALNELGARLNLNGHPPAAWQSNSTGAPTFEAVGPQAEGGLGGANAPAAPFAAWSRETAAASAPPAVSRWQHREPLGAIVLIALGLLFLMGETEFFSSWIFKFTWPVVLIALGVWLIVRRLRGVQGECK